MRYLHVFLALALALVVLSTTATESVASPAHDCAVVIDIDGGEGAEDGAMNDALISTLARPARLRPLVARAPDRVRITGHSPCPPHRPPD